MQWCNTTFLIAINVLQYYNSTLLLFLAIDCGGLSAPQNGSLQGSATTFPNMLEFSCDEGFILEGSASRACQANGTWSGNTTLCEGIV